MPKLMASVVVVVVVVVVIVVVIVVVVVVVVGLREGKISPIGHEGGKNQSVSQSVSQTD